LTFGIIEEAPSLLPNDLTVFIELAGGAYMLRRGAELESVVAFLTDDAVVEKPRVLRDARALVTMSFNAVLSIEWACSAHSNRVHPSALPNRHSL
jgi:hypothetical protein